MHAMNQDERRQSPRTEIHCDLQLQPLGALASSAPVSGNHLVGSHHCTSEDISASGARVSADRAYPVNARLMLTFECNEHGFTHLTSCEGSVVWVKLDASRTRCTLGIRFLDEVGEEIIASAAVRSHMH